MNERCQFHQFQFSPHIECHLVFLKIRIQLPIFLTIIQIELLNNSLFLFSHAVVVVVVAVLCDYLNLLIFFVSNYNAIFMVFVFVLIFNSDYTLSLFQLVKRFLLTRWASKWLTLAWVGHFSEIAKFRWHFKKKREEKRKKEENILID